MMYAWREIDGFFIDRVSRFANFLTRDLGIKHPYLLASWRIAFILSFFVSAAVCINLTDSWVRWVPISMIVLSGEFHRLLINRLIADGRKEWTKAVYSTYAAKAEHVRSTQIFFRCFALVLCVFIMVTSANDYFDSTTVLESVWNLSLFLYAAPYLLGVYLDAAYPALPDDGHKQFHAEPKFV